MTIDIRIGDSRELIHELPDKSVDCCVTSPPYWGLRDYKTEPIIFDGLQDCEHDFSIEITKEQSGGKGYKDTVRGSHFGVVSTSFCSKCGAWRGQLGLEPTPELFIKHLLDFFDDVKLKLKAEGNCFVNLGDTYSGSGCGTNDYRTEKSKSINGKGKNAVMYKTGGIAQKLKSIPAKSLCMIPQRFAWGMIERGWILRNEIIWSKPNHMPESVTDRLTKAHEVIYHFVKQQRYYYNLDAIRESHKESSIKRDSSGYNTSPMPGRYQVPWERRSGTDEQTFLNSKGKNPGDVWQVTTQPYSEAHFAVFPLELVRRPILAGCPISGTVLDPFGGSGTVGEFCRHNDRNAILFDLNPEYGKLIRERTMANIPELDSFCEVQR